MISHIVIASDHAGLDAKALIKTTLDELGITCDDLGPYDTNSVDYPDYAHKLAATMADGHADMGVLVCGSGIGISIAANRHAHLRAALCHNAETATLSRQHNNANVLVLGARVLNDATIVEAVRAFFTTEFEGGRHTDRIAKLTNR